MKTIVCFGDSNTHGYSALDHGRFPPEDRWPRVMARVLGPEYEVLEEGLSGRTIAFEDPLQEGLCGMALLSPVLLTHEPIDTLIVMLGTNDTKERFGSSAQVITIAMQRFVQKAMALPVWRSKPDIVITAPVPIDPGIRDTFYVNTMGAGCVEKSRQLAQLYRELAQTLGVRFFDAGSVGELNTIDFMHLTAEGNHQIGTALAEFLAGGPSTQ